MSLGCLHSGYQDVLVPAHSTTHGEVVFSNGVVKDFPSSRMRAIVGQTPPAGYRNVFSVRRCDRAANGPMVG